MVDILKSLFFEKLKGKIIYYAIGVLLLIAIWCFVPKIAYDIAIKNFSLDLILRIMISVFIISYLIYDSLKINKNKSKLPGLGIYISSSVLEKDDIRKNLLLSTLKDRIKNEYEVIVYEKNDLFRLYKKYNFAKIMEKLNLAILFEVAERTGKKNNKDIYEVKIINTSLKIPYFIGDNCSKMFERDLTNSLNLCLEISNENNISDVDNEISLFELGLDYIQSILLSVSLTPEKAFGILDRLSGILSVTNINKKNINYIRKNIKYRYIDTYYSAILKILYKEKYYLDVNILNRLKFMLLEYKKLLDKYKKEIPIKQYNLLINNFYLQIAIVLYEENNIEEALENIYKCDLTISPNSGILFSKAFLLANNNQYWKSYYLYQKLSKKNDYSEESLDEIIKFIEERYNLNEKNLPVKFCLAIVNYYFKDKVLAKKYFEELCCINSEIKKIYEEICK